MSTSIDDWLRQYEVVTGGLPKNVDHFRAFLTNRGGSASYTDCKKAVSGIMTQAPAQQLQRKEDGKSALKRCEDIQKLFDRFDTDRSGELDENELMPFFREAFPNQLFQTGELKALVSELDLDDSGTIGLNELRAFLRWYDPETKMVTRKSALIVIDVQNDFITGTLANAYEAKDIVPIINNLREIVDIVVISYDWHPEHHCSFVESANVGKIALKGDQKEFAAFASVTLVGDADRAEHLQMLYPRHAVQNTEGSACHADLIVKDNDVKIYKGTKPNIDSYSAFYDNCKANDTGLLAQLDKAGVTDVYCVGLVFDICVMSSALHAAELGFRTRVVEEACRPLSKDNIEATKEKLAKAGVIVQTVKEAQQEIQAFRGTKQSSIVDYLKEVRIHKKAKATHNEENLSSHQ